MLLYCHPGETRHGEFLKQLDGYGMARAMSRAGGSISADDHAFLTELGGAKLDTAEIKNLFSTLGKQGRQLHAKYLPEIRQRASTLNPAGILSMICGRAAA